VQQRVQFVTRTYTAHWCACFRLFSDDPTITVRIVRVISYYCNTAGRRGGTVNRYLGGGCEIRITTTFDGVCLTRQVQKPFDMGGACHGHRNAVIHIYCTVRKRSTDDSGCCKAPGSPRSGTSRILLYAKAQHQPTRARAV